MEKSVKKERFEESQLDLFGLSFHVYPSSGCSICFRRIDMHAQHWGKIFVYSNLFVLNMWGFGFGITNYTSAWKNA